MNNEGYRSPYGRIIRYDVDCIDGKFVKIPVYENAPYESESEAGIDSNDGQKKSVRTDGYESRHRASFGDRAIAKAAIYLSIAAGVTYAADATSTYVQHGEKIISPYDAYQDFTQLPEFFAPTIDTVKTITTLLTDSEG